MHQIKPISETPFKKAPISELLKRLSADERKKCKRLFEKQFDVDRGQYYNVINGVKKNLTLEEALFFSSYLKIDIKELVDPIKLQSIMNIISIPDDKAYRSARSLLMHQVILKQDEHSY